jgi:hypothetical protein
MAITSVQIQSLSREVGRAHPDGGRLYLAYVLLDIAGAIDRGDDDRLGRIADRAEGLIEQFEQRCYGRPGYYPDLPESEVLANEGWESRIGRLSGQADGRQDALRFALLGLAELTGYGMEDALGAMLLEIEDERGRLESRSNAERN